MQRASLEKRQQMEQGRAYVELVANQAALQMQREGQANPPHFLRNSGAKHKSRKNQKGVEGKVAGRGRKKSITPPTLSAILQKLNQAKGVNVDNVAQDNVSPLGEFLLGSGPEPRPVRPVPPTPSFPNPPLVSQVLFTVTVCQGCPNQIDSRNLVPPNDLLIKMMMVRPYRDSRTNYWHDKISNGYFHLNIACLQKFNPTLSVEDLTMTNEMFCNISQVHMDHLKRLGFLHHIANNIEKSLQVSLYSLRQARTRKFENRMISGKNYIVFQTSLRITQIMCDSQKFS